jgi:sugar/nucleoside kinase (ribokinase family)
MDPKARLLAALAARPAALGGRTCLVGCDGFVDTIVVPVARRDGPGEDFTAFAGIAEFGGRVAGAAGQSANFELYPRREQPGGNGPIMAGALAALGAAVTCVGTFGRPELHPAFAGLAARARLLSLAEPARTTALEFPDGKIMLGMMRSLEEVTPAALAAAFGGDGYRAALAAADLVVLGNWTMIPHMTEIYDDLTGRLLPALPGGPHRIFFFDLADPAKRSPADLADALGAIARFAPFGRAVLGLNLAEARQVLAALALGPEPETREGQRAAAARIRGRLGLAAVVVHPKECAVCATPDGSWWQPGPYTPRPLLSTGGGDHFNAGFAAGLLLGLDPEACLLLGVTTSGAYVRTGRSPATADLAAALA